jgi:hypothetical protein
MMTHRIENIVRTSSKSALLFTGGGAHQFRWFVLFSPTTYIFFSFAQQTSEKSDFGEKRTSREKAKERRHNARARLHTHTQNVPRKAGEEKELFAREPSRYTSSSYYY